MSYFVVNSPATKFIKPELPHRAFVMSAVALLVALILAVSRAFNTGDLGVLHRFCLWAVVCALIAIQVLSLSHLLRRYIPANLPYLSLISGMISVLLTIPLLALQLHGLKYTPLLPKQPDPPLEFLLFVAPPVAVIGGIFLLVRYLLQHPLYDTQHDVKASSEIEASFTPEWRKSKTLRIQVDDHYLQIVSESGDYYVRGKLSEAISLLSPEEGIQVHRSHWVSFEHIKDLLKDGRDYRVLLLDGNSVPLSRGRLVAVKRSWKDLRAGRA